MRIKKIQISTKRIISLLVTALLILIVVVLGFIRANIVKKLTDQTEAARWGSEVRCGQASVFFNQSSQIKRDNILEFDYKINKALIKEGMQGADALPEDDNTVWASCYSAVGTINVVHGRKSVDAVAYGVGGDFFYFHPLKLASGSYFDGNAVMKDYCLLDEDLAWQLYGSNDIVGEHVEIQGIPHLICGVVRKDRGKLAKAAGLSGPIIYTSFESLATYGTIDSTAISAGKTKDEDSKEKDDAGDSDTEVAGATSDVAEDAGGIICYEVVMPSPVEGYVPAFIQTVLGLDIENLDIIDNTARFNNQKLLTTMTQFGMRSMSMKSLIYPYWENMARGYEDISILLLLLQMIIGTAALVVIIVMIVNSYAHKKWTIESVLKGIGDKIYDIEAGIKNSHTKWKYF